MVDGSTLAPKGVRDRDEAMRELEAIALGVVVGQQGARAREQDRLRERIERARLRASSSDIENLFRSAKERFDRGAACFFLCTGHACLEKLSLINPREIEGLFEPDGSCSFSMTGCQGPCKQAPVATLRVGTSCEMFAQMSTRDEWRTVGAFAVSAASAGSLLVDASGVEDFRFDPVHGSGRPGVHLERLRFMWGHFRGEGRFSDGGSFYKESVGGWEAKGRFIALRMVARYPLAHGGTDVHQALVLVGLNPKTGRLEGRAYTDAGAIEDYELDLAGQTVKFAERIPHGTGARLARKTLRATRDGFEEVLEIEKGPGELEKYSSIRLERVQSSGTWAGVHGNGQWLPEGDPS